MIELKELLKAPGASTSGVWIVLGAVFNERSAHLHFLKHTSGMPPPGFQIKFITQIQHQIEAVLRDDQNNAMAKLGTKCFDPMLGWDVRTTKPMPGRASATFQSIDSFLTKAKLYCKFQNEQRKKNRRDNVNPSQEELEDISMACNKLWELDFDDRLKPGIDYEINLQRTTGGRRDAAPDDLFSYVDDKKLQTPVFRTFLPLLDNYEFEPGKAEHHDGPKEKKEVSDFLDACMETPCLIYVYKWLSSNKRFQGDKRAFKKKLNELWFNGYSRASRNRREDDSSAFEHVFVGEHKRDRRTGP